MASDHEGSWLVQVASQSTDSRPPLWEGMRALGGCVLYGEQAMGSQTLESSPNPPPPASSHPTQFKPILIQYSD